MPIRFTIHLHKVDVTPWCPREVVADPALREFVRTLYLSGNGAVIFGNSFVEWAASEALRAGAASLSRGTIQRAQQAQAVYWSGRIRGIRITSIRFPP